MLCSRATYIHTSLRAPHSNVCRTTARPLFCQAFSEQPNPTVVTDSAEADSSNKSLKARRGVGQRGPGRRPGYWLVDANFWRELEPHLLHQSGAQKRKGIILPKLRDLHQKGFGCLAQAISKRGGTKRIAAQLNLQVYPRTAQNAEHSKRMEGCKCSDSQKEAMREAAIGRQHSAETKQKISAALKGRTYLTKRRRGRSHTAETKKKISDALQGQKHATKALRQQLSHQSPDEVTRFETSSKQAARLNPASLAQVAEELAALRRDLTKARMHAEKVLNTKMTFEDTAKLSSDLLKKHQRYVELRAMINSM